MFFCLYYIMICEKLHETVFSVEFIEQTWTCRFPLFLFVWTIRTMLHKAIGIWSHDHS